MLNHNRMLNQFPTFFSGGALVAFLRQLMANNMIFAKVEA